MKYNHYNIIVIVFIAISFYNCSKSDDINSNSAAGNANLPEIGCFIVLNAVTDAQIGAAQIVISTQDTSDTLRTNDIGRACSAILKAYVTEAIFSANGFETKSHPNGFFSSPVRLIPN